MEQPRNIFEQLMQVLKIMNDNIIVVSGDVKKLYERFDVSPSELSVPTVTGAETDKEEIGGK